MNDEFDVEVESTQDDVAEVQAEQVLNAVPTDEQVEVPGHLVRGRRNRVQLLARKFAFESHRLQYLKLETVMIEALGTDTFDSAQHEFNSFMVDFIGKANIYLKY